MGLACGGFGLGVDAVATDEVASCLLLEAAVPGAGWDVAAVVLATLRAVPSLALSSADGRRKTAAYAPRANTLSTMPSHNILELPAAGVA